RFAVASGFASLFASCASTGCPKTVTAPAAPRNSRRLIEHSCREVIVTGFPDVLPNELDGKRFLIWLEAPDSPWSAQSDVAQYEHRIPLPTQPAMSIASSRVRSRASVPSRPE